MVDGYMTVDDLIKECLRGELTVDRLKAYGNKLNRFADEYADKRADEGYNKRIQTDMNELVGYFRNGLPKQIRDGTIDFLWDGDPKEALKSFVEDISKETLSFKIRLEKPLI